MRWYRHTIPKGFNYLSSGYGTTTMLNNLIVKGKQIGLQAKIDSKFFIATSLNGTC